MRWVFAWNVPNCHNYWKENPGGGCGCDDKPTTPQTWKNYYATVFPDAVASAAYSLKNWERLEDGSFYGWEGCHAAEGCCEGSCTHVWNYAYALPFLFPCLERSMRELDFRHNQRADGGMGFRLQLPVGSEQSSFRPCADGQFGGVLKVYREWKISGDTDWLRGLWPAVRKSIEFAWAPTNEDRWDPGKTGVLHGRQHHTLDMELFGPNAWLTGFYRAALKAGAEMAEVCGLPEAAGEYRAIFERGRKWIARHLFNGEYFTQRIDLGDRDLLKPFEKDASIWGHYWSEEHGELKYQVGEGCGIDQVLAQWHAELIGLGSVLDPEQTRCALRAIWRHNFRPSMRDVFNPCRLFCVDDEAGTVMFVWPKGRRRPVVPVPYAEETMHGFEYQAACHLIMTGMVKEGVAIVKAVRDRYDGERRNPWNEIECGSNYARSMASYALLNAFSGLQFDMVRQELGFHPVHAVGGRFKCFWCLGTAWGEIDIRPDGAKLHVHQGELTIRTLSLDLAGGDTVSVTLQGRHVPHQRDGAVIAFARPMTIHASATLRIIQPS